MAAILLLVVGATAPAHAADELSVSSDGRTWSADLERPLFDPATRWAPGDRRTAVFWVRNDADEPGRLSVDVRTLGPSADTFDDLVVEASGGSVTWAEEPGPDGAGTATVAAGETERITVDVRLPSWSRNLSQLDRVDLELLVRLEGGRRPGPSGPGDGPSRLLPDTGGVGVWLFGAVVGLLAGGLLLVGRERREKEKES